VLEPSRTAAKTGNEETWIMVDIGRTLKRSPLRTLELRVRNPATRFWGNSKRIEGATASQPERLRRRDSGITQRGELTVTILRILGVAAFACVISTPNARAQTKGGGAVSGGIRGAVAGEISGWSEEAATGAKTGVVTEATRAAIDRETQALARYRTTADYQKAQHSNFEKARSEVLGAGHGKGTKSGVEAVIGMRGKPVVGITFPADWNQRNQANFITAVSPDGQVYCMLVAIKAVRTKQYAIQRIKTGLSTNDLNDIKYDEPKEGATVITGTGKGKKSGVDVVFATGIFESGDQLVAVTFLADLKIEDYYKETIRGICQTIRRAGRD
jgi:hypothetical protein